MRLTANKIEKIPPSHKGLRKKLIFLYPRKPSTWHPFYLVPQTEFVELLKLMRGFISRILSVLFLVPVLRTNYTETQTDGFQLSVF